MKVVCKDNSTEKKSIASLEFGSTFVFSGDPLCDVWIKTNEAERDSIAAVRLRDGILEMLYCGVLVIEVKAEVSFTRP